MTLQYLGVGMSRTGTASLREALALLGFDACHWEPERLADVLLATAEAPDFRRYDDCDAIVDMPHALFFREIGQAYPGLKYILTERDVDAWYVSMCRHHWNMRAHLQALEPTVPQALALGRAQLKLAYGLAEFEDVQQNAMQLKRRFQEWNAFVKASLPPAQLLVLNICDGRACDSWQLLCDFVARPVPANISFPYRNRSDSDGSA